MRERIAVWPLCIWAFRDERAGWDGAAPEPGAGGIDSIARIIRNANEGGISDRRPRHALSGGSGAASDAVWVVECLHGWAGPERALLARCARAGRAPDWMPLAWHRWEAADLRWCDEADAWQAVAERCDWHEDCHWQPGTEWVNGRNRRRVVPTWCRVRERDGPAEVEHARAQYLGWWRCLDWLRQRLASAPMERWAVSAEMPEREPWRPVRVERPGRHGAERQLAPHTET